MGRFLASFCIIANVIVAGSLFTYPLFSPALTKALGLTMAQTNSIAVGAIGGQYFTAAFFGALVDSRGPGITCFCGAVLLSSGYALMALSLSSAQAGDAPAPIDPSMFLLIRNAVPSTWIFLTSYYLLAGAGTSASYFASVTTAVKTFPRHAGLAIGVPCAAFGLSPLVMSRIGTALFTLPDGELDAVSFLVFLAVTLGVVNLFSTFALKEPDVGALAEDDVSEDADGEDETTPLIAHSDVHSLRSFLTDPDVYIFGVVLALTAGPAEAMVASIGSITESLLDPSSQGWPSETALQIRSKHVQILAACNTISRLATGALSDAFCPAVGETNKDKPSALHFFAFVTMQFGLALWWAASSLTSTSQLYALSIPSGLATGGIFSIAPAIVAKKWHFKHFGRNFGLVILFAALGACLFTEMYGFVSDLNRHSAICRGRQCFVTSFWVMGASLLLGTFGALFLSRKRGWAGSI